MANQARQPRHPRNFSQPQSNLPGQAQSTSGRPRRSWPGAQHSSGPGRIPQGAIWLQSQPKLGHRDVKLKVFGHRGIHELRPGPHDTNVWNAPAALAACEEYAAALVDPSVIRNDREDMLFFLRGHSLRAARCTDQNPGEEGPNTLIMAPQRQNFAGFPHQMVPQAALAEANFLAGGNFVAAGNFLVGGNFFAGGNFVAAGNFLAGGNFLTAGITPPSERSTVSSGGNVPRLPGPQRRELQNINQNPPAAFQPAPTVDRVQATQPVFNRTTSAPVDPFDSSEEIRYNQEGNPLTLRDLVKVSPKEDRWDRQFVPWPLPPSRRVSEQADERHNSVQRYDC